MALLIARFLHFYPGYTDTTVMKMNAKRFFVLNRKINRILAEEEATAITVAHTSKPGDRLNELIQRIKGIERGAPSASVVLKAVAGEAQYEETPGEVAALRERQKAAAERIKKERQEWLARKAQQKPASP